MNKAMQGKVILDINDYNILQREIIRLNKMLDEQCELNSGLYKAFSLKENGTAIGLCLAIEANTAKEILKMKAEEEGLALSEHELIDLSTDTIEIGPYTLCYRYCKKKEGETVDENL